MVAEKSRSPWRQAWVPVALGVLVFLGLWAARHHEFLLFHTLAEVFSVAIAGGVFMIAWNVRDLLANRYLLVAGIGFLFTSAVDLLHALTYKGMNVVPGCGVDVPTQLWLTARAIQASALLAAPLVADRKVRPAAVLAAFAGATAVLVAAIAAGIFPACLVEGRGLTPFKRAGEMAIVAALVVAGALLLRLRTRFDRTVLGLLLGGIAAAACSEIAFTLYSDPYDLENLIGHFLKIVSFYLIYKALIETGLARPYALLLADLKRGEERLRESEERYRSLVELSPEPVAVHDGERYIYVNPAAARLFGASRAEDVVGRKVLDLVDPGERAAIEVRIRKIFEGDGRTDLREVRILGVDGGRADVEIAGIRIAYRGAPAVQLAMRDVSERKRRETLQKLLADSGAALGSSPDEGELVARLAAVAVPSFADACRVEVAGSEGGVRSAEAHLDAAAGVLLAGLVAVPPGAGTATLIPGPRSAILAPVAAGGRKFGTIAFLSPAGSAYGPADLATGEELARRAAIALENLRLNRELTAASNAKDRFLAVLSHELRTPLTPVLAASTALEGQEGVPDSIREDIAMMRRNVELEARLIDDLLDLTRIARGKLVLQKSALDLHAVIDDALRIVAPDIAAKGIRVRCRLDAGSSTVLGDGARLRQVFWNLVKNAVKFTPAGGWIEVRTAARDRSIETAVADGGIGIEPDALSRIFDPFEQASPEIVKKYGGLGLGLAISKAVAELHGGDLRAASAGPGQGATFTVTLPLQAGVVLHGEERAPAPASGLRTAAILLVEDHPDSARLMARLLGRQGHRVTVAESLAEARAAAGRSDFDVVVSDLNLPDGSGLDLMRELRGRKGPAGIALSGFGMEKDVQASLAAGFAVHLTKPIPFPALLAALEKVLGRARPSGVAAAELGTPPASK